MLTPTPVIFAAGTWNASSPSSALPSTTLNPISSILPVFFVAVARVRVYDRLCDAVFKRGLRVLFGTGAGNIDPAAGIQKGAADDCFKRSDDYGKNL